MDTKNQDLGTELRIKSSSIPVSLYFIPRNPLTQCSEDGALHDDTEAAARD